MKILIKELTGAALDYAVACCEQRAWELYNQAVEYEHDVLPDRPSEYIGDYEFDPEEFKPSSDWAVGGPIIERLRIESYGRSCGWGANLEGIDRASYGPTILIAAMRCYVSSVFFDSDDVEIPEQYCS